MSEPRILVERRVIVHSAKLRTTHLRMRLFYTFFIIVIQYDLSTTKLEEMYILGLSCKTKKNWFGFPTGLMNNKFYALFFLSIQYFIWNAKLNHRLPSVSFCLGESIQLLDNLSRLSPGIFNSRDNYDCVLSRSWDRLRARRW